jgi:hypothetical protein
MIEIKTGNVPCCIYISDVPEHLSFKKWFLNYLNSNKIFSIINKQHGNIIYNTDYFVTKFHEEYREIILPIFNNHNLSLFNYLQYSENDFFRIKNIWFQQYAKGDGHSWHRHDGVFSSIYYVDLPDGASLTTFRFQGKEFEVDVREGQILTIPSFFEHCSKPSKSVNLKTVIAFNSE